MLLYLGKLYHAILRIKMISVTPHMHIVRCNSERLHTLFVSECNQVNVQVDFHNILKVAMTILWSEAVSSTCCTDSIEYVESKAWLQNM